MHQLARVITLIEDFNDGLGKRIAWLTLAMVLVQFAIVVLRYLFNTGWIAMQESVLYMHACLFLLGAAYTLRHDAHVRVDIFYRDGSPRFRALVDLFGTLLFLLPVCGFILWVSWDYVAVAWELREGSREAGGLPGVFLLKGTILILAFTLLLQAVAIMLKNLIFLLGHKTPQKGQH